MSEVPNTPKPPDIEEQTWTELREWQGEMNAFRAESTLFRKSTVISLKTLEKELEENSKKLDENTAMTSAMHEGLKDTLPALKDAAGAWRTVERIAKLGKPLFYFVALGGALYAWAKTGKWELPVAP